MESNGLSSSFLERACPYCGIHLSLLEMQNHLEWCEVQESMIEAFNRNSARSRLFSTLRHQHLVFHSDHATTSEEDISYPDRSSDSSSFMSEKFDYSQIHDCLSSPPPKPSKSAASCPVCFNDYSQLHYFPLVLPLCGHTVCRPCLNEIVEHATMIKCPVCRTLNFNEVEALPGNFALLELVQLQDQRDLCPKHSLEIVGFCRDEDSLLCGACVFEHRDHDSFLLSDQRSLEIASAKKSQLAEREHKLNTLKESWTSVLQQLKAQYSEINGVAEQHVNALKVHKKVMIQEIKEGTRRCVEQVKALAQENEVSKLQEQANNSIQKIQAELQLLKNKQKRFESLTIVEKLAKVDLVDEALPEPPVLSSHKQLPSMLTGTVDYRKVILQKNLTAQPTS